MYGDNILNKQRNKIRVLIVDDITEVRHSTARLLKEEIDIEVVGFASNGKEAIEEYDRLLPDIMTTCICMPKMNGIESTDNIVKKHPDAKIIIISVQNEPDYMRRAMLAGAKDFLPKPVSKDELIATIYRIGKLPRRLHHESSSFITREQCYKIYYDFLSRIITNIEDKAQSTSIKTKIDQIQEYIMKKNEALSSKYITTINDEIYCSVIDSLSNIYLMTPNLIETIINQCNNEVVYVISNSNLDYQKQLLYYSEIFLYNPSKDYDLLSTWKEDSQRKDPYIIDNLESAEKKRKEIVNQIMIHEMVEMYTRNSEDSDLNEDIKCTDCGIKFINNRNLNIHYKILHTLIIFNIKSSITQNAIPDIHNKIAKNNEGEKPTEIKKEILIFKNQRKDNINLSSLWTLAIILSCILLIGISIFSSNANNATIIPYKTNTILIPTYTIPTFTPFPTIDIRPYLNNDQSNNEENGCPDGCTYHKSGCDIKGNISYTTGEKIYHLPTDKYYYDTEIEPSIGERWFCTEEEARTNGWRHSRV
jgi:YesN/AraC family two-component response regulator